MNKIEAVQKTVYRCTVCGEDYAELVDAERNCGSYELEPPRFALGDKVSVIQHSVWEGMPAKHIMTGVVVDIIGPLPGEKTNTSGRSMRFCLKAHVYKYDVKSEETNQENMTMEGCWSWELRKVQ